MFILRQITKHGLESNLCLGERYQIAHKEHNTDEFERELGVTVTHPDQDDIHAIISYSNGSDSHPLYKNFYYYIMTESGRTFANVSYKL